MRTNSLSTTFIWLLLIALAVAPGGSDGADNQSRAEVTAAESSAAATEGKEPVAQYARLKGRWQRPDGGYLLEIKAVADDGAMDAAYFNPRPIHVGSAQAMHQDGRLYVMVKLQDVNYPGSTYRLMYDPTKDRLIGTYYQAVARETYRVLFVRVKP